MSAEVQPPVYAGVGSRDAPSSALATIEQAAAALARLGWVLRTGMSPGADRAFYRGARRERGRIELFLPAPGFGEEDRDSEEEGSVRELARPHADGYRLAERFYRARDGREWQALTDRERALLARDVHQVLGWDLRSPAACVVCWTPDGGLDGEDPRSRGTGQALRVACAHAIRVCNLARAEHARRLRASLGLGP